MSLQLVRVLLTAFVAAGLATAAGAAELVDVRVGSHPTYTRVVFELDGPGGYSIERQLADDGTPQLLVTLDAASTPRSMNSGSVMVERVAIQDGLDRSLAHIRLKHKPSRVKEMILSKPSRLVFDFVYPEDILAARKAAAAKKVAAKAPAKPVAKKVATAKPTAKPVATTSRTAKPSPSVKPPATAKPAVPEKPIAVAKPTPAAKPVAKVTPVVPVPKPEAKPAPIAIKPAAQAVKTALVPVPKADAIEKAGAIEKPVTNDKPGPIEKPGPLEKPEGIERVVVDVKADVQAKRDAAERKLAGARDLVAQKLAAAKDEVEAAADAADSQIAAAKPDIETPTTRSSVPPAPASSQASASDGTNWSLMAGAGAGVLALFIGFVLWNRRRALPNDIDVTALADDARDADSGSEFAMGLDEPQGSESVFNDPTPESAYEDAPGASDIAAGPGLFDDDSEKENDAMDLESPDLPMERTASEMPTQMNVAPPTASAAGDGDVARLMREMEARLVKLETRLDEANDSRERLERQVTAQAEELRVQRAAIARTQRALRGMSSGDEDQATEPAIRQPSS